MIITLCGSARFEAQFKHWNLLLTLAGHIVHTLAAFPSDMGSKDWYTDKQKAMLDEVYLRKIENSDAIFVLNIDGYVGAGLVREIAHARTHGKLIYYAEGDDSSAVLYQEKPIRRENK